MRILRDRSKSAENLNELMTLTKKGGRISVIADYYALTNGFNGEQVRQSLAATTMQAQLLCASMIIQLPPEAQLMFCRLARPSWCRIARNTLLPFTNRVALVEPVPLQSEP